MTSAQSKRCWGFHQWRMNFMGIWVEVPGSILSGPLPEEMVCMRCGRRKPLRWTEGTF